MLSRECETLLRNSGFTPLNNEKTKWQAPRFQIEFYQDFTYYSVRKELKSRKKVTIINLYNDLGRDLDFDLKLFTKTGVFRTKGEKPKP